MVSFAFVSSICSLALYSSTSPSSSSSSFSSSSSSSSSSSTVPTRLPTLRTNIYSINNNNDSTSASASMTFSTTEPCITATSPEQALAELEQRTTRMNERVAQGQPFTEEELQGILHSIQNVNPVDHNIDYEALKQLLKEVAHLSHKDWAVTEANAKRLGAILFQHGGMSTTAAHQMLERIVNEGNWDAAVQHATTTSTTEEKPPSFAVLVTGVNGIRKTSSMYQPWFADLLQEALVVPPNAPNNFAIADLPTGHNSFFRQLDHMIATLCNTEFATLYRLTSQMLQADKQHEHKDDDAKKNHISPQVVLQAYSNYKAALFTRYRTLSELLGANLLQQAARVNANCLMETSGRDVAMFHYVDHFFDTNSNEYDDGNNDDDDESAASSSSSSSAAKQQYHKLALHFQINDLRYAQDSVDQRMKDEMEAGIHAIQTGDAFDVIQANAGGPYGSEVLPDVQESSDCVWNDIILKSDGVGHDWYKATILIHAHNDDTNTPWTAQAVKPDGSLGKEYVFGPKRTL